MKVLRIDSRAREEFIEITREVNTALTELAADRPGGPSHQNGIAHLFCRHTTAGLTVNENADPDVRRDMLLALSRIVPEDLAYRHAEGNSTAHVKASLLGCALMLPVREGRLALGRWQGVDLCEVDGPRSAREIEISYLPSL
jgi:secondary thiamine-phosphate synthase enzyme